MMNMKSQAAIEYMFMIAAALIIVVLVVNVVLKTMNDLVRLVDDYAEKVRKEVLEDM